MNVRAFLSLQLSGEANNATYTDKRDDTRRFGPKVACHCTVYIPDTLSAR